ncbi:hypothetical protein L3X38_041182 [Prunus dulcis]|uniref:Uncharacterized protein n=1 Tax=Prunus dulcis TaxID=3755 RepID=A0AAD4YKD9_PRUDU|nr:hypothetical protein L3X38_041182 [Prunus dulcis]
MHPRRPRTRGGRVPRWGANPPPPSQPHSPPPSPPVEEHAEGNEPNFRHLLSQFTRTISTALQGRQSTEDSDIKRVKELGAKEFFGTWIRRLEILGASLTGCCCRPLIG